MTRPGELAVEPVGVGGLGDPLNAYAHTMLWHGDRLFVGTTRANLCLIHANDPPDLRPWPVRCPPDVYDLDLRAQIWSYAPDTNAWTRVHVSPTVLGDGGPIPRDIGYRGMGAFQGPGDPRPCLYVSTWSPPRGAGALVLRSADGGAFEPVSEPGLGGAQT